MAESRGKLFEREVKRGLDMMPGMAIRLFDGAAYAKQRMPGDFVYAATNSFTYLIECKSTSQNSFPYANISEHQIEDVWRWGESAAMYRLGVYMVEFWKHKRCFMIRGSQMRHMAANSGRKSLPLEEAQRIGIEVERNRDGRSFFYDMRSLEHEGGLPSPEEWFLWE